MHRKVPVNSFLLGGNERKYLTECVDTGWISGEGPFIEKFETSFSKFIGRRFATTVANGSAALDIAIQAVGISPGDEVIMPTFTIISPALSVVRVGGVPVLVDSDSRSYNMNVDEIERKITNKTKAIIMVHIYGLPVEVDKILALAEKYQLKVIEDAAEMHAQTYKGKMCGTFGHVSIFSFYANKLITSGEGGMVLTDDPEIDKTCRRLKNLAFHPDKPRFVHEEIGYNYRMTNMQAALGLAQLEQVETFLQRKRGMGKYYNTALQFLVPHGYQLPLPANADAENIYWVYPLVAPTEEEKNRAVDYLAKRGIGTRPFFWCMHEQPLFINMNLFAGESYPESEKLARRGFYIPSGVALAEEDLETVVKTLRDIYE
ncbi:DegT/DnrJ/EryC1/StrS family aminotransferase [Segetibacter sp. 3557_3]|uniref:DegT/DnrJ/EryC1/StrS family aminotransferase n=1 Tax=Segetibacter sp. 3557_3 TaxID=2547429 RepID=UPI001058B1F0|nr:DegT/DnrJ/EryC1/StrS family aminotransferase [Segetibacter sp. 3557_3]TDH27832.1 DegT/DnrJ/EryC1/StrS family aminotransferase [Segetibacter sp. 3557_3]